MIAIDAMGRGFAPRITVLGALRVARRGVAVALYGAQVAPFHSFRSMVPFVA